MADIEFRIDREDVNFGDLSAEIDELLHRGVVAYRHDPDRADALFCRAIGAGPTLLPIYFCLYELYIYRGRLDDAVAAA